MNSNALMIATAIEESDLIIGNSRVSDDVWDLGLLVPDKTRPNASKRICFSDIASPEMRFVIKQYMYYKIGQVKPKSAIVYFYHIKRFSNYCWENGISSFSEVTTETLLAFAIWLKDAKGVSKRTGYLNSFSVEELIRVGQVKGWNVTTEDVLTGATAKEIWGSGKDPNASSKYEPIPDDIFDKIVSCALTYEAYHSDNVITKCGILIQSQTGLRIGEVLSLKSGCLHEQDDGPAYIEVLISKTSKGEPIRHKVFANEIVVNAIKELEMSTAYLREESGMDDLFLHNSRGVICVASVSNWSKDRLGSFIRRCDIRDHNGELYPLKSHQFRATFVKHLVMKNIPIAYVMKQFQHVSVEMTCHYLTLKEHEVKQMYSELILKPDAVIAGKGADRIKAATENVFKGKTEIDVNRVISSLAKTLSFNPLPGGVCLYDYRRGNCANGDGCFFYNCPNFVTETSFLPVLRKELDLMEKEMCRTEKLGYERQWQIQNSRYQCLLPLIRELEERSNGKEN